MRRHLFVVPLLPAVLTVVLAGCGGTAKGPDVASAGDKPSASPEPADLEAQGRKFAACMRENGVDMPDPVSEGDGGGFNVRIGPGEGGEPLDKAKVDAAMEKCRQFAPNGGEPPKLNPEQIEQARKMAKCMRENGLPNFPDPDENGMLRIDGDAVGAGPGDPVFEEAQRKCEQYAPKGGRQGTQGNK